MKKYIQFAIIITVFVIIAVSSIKKQFNKSATSRPSDLTLAKAEKRDFEVTVKAVGELEAARSTVIASAIKGDLGKIIYIIPDGVNVKPGDVILKMDPTPFEEKLEKLKSQISEQQDFIETLEKTLEWEKVQAEHEIKTATFEVETSELELDKLINGDGPMELSRLKGAMQKAWLKFDELSSYSQDLLALQEQGFLNPSETRQAQKKLAEEQEAYEAAQLQYESYIKHVYPMQLKKAETAVKRSKGKFEETAKSAGYKIGKAQAQLEQSRLALNNFRNQLKDQEKELAMTEIKAPAPGMVVHREDYRAGQRRKPRLGDVLVKNQPLIDLPDLDSMVIKTKVREVDLFKVAIGKKVTVQVDAYPQLVFTGTVSSIGVLALSDLSRASEEKYFEVRINLDQGDPRLRPGMTTRATIHAYQVANCLTVPLHAIFEQDKQSYCYVPTWRGFDKRPIEVGMHNEFLAEVKSGIEDRDTICLTNPFLKEEE